MNILNRTFAEITGKKTAGDIGIEVEVEGKIKINPGATKWTTHEDGSLRGGIEFVTQSPIEHKEIDWYVADLKRLTKGSEFVPSIRTSVHVHVNFLKSTVLEAYTVMMIYWLFENMLVELQNEHRKSNLHCLRLSDSHSIFSNAIDEIKQKRPFKSNGKTDLRYAALNLAALAKFGSLEFRMLEFSKDIDKIAIWADALYTFVERAKQQKFESILDITRSDPRDVIKFFWPNDVGTAILGLSNDLIYGYFEEHRDKIEMLWKKIEIVIKESSVDFGREDDLDPEDKPNYPEDEVILFSSAEINMHFTPGDISSIQVAHPNLVAYRRTTGGFLTQEDLEHWGHTPSTMPVVSDEDDDF